MHSTGYHHIGIAASVLLFIMLAVLVLRWPRGVHETFSAHAAQSKTLGYYYAGIFLSTLPIITWVFSSYIAVKYELSWIPVALLTFSALMQIICTFFPEVGANVRPHRIFAGLSALSLVILLAELGIFEPSLPSTVRTITIFAAVLMAVISVASMLHRRYVLLYQIGYYFVFFIAYWLLLFY